MSQPQDAEKIIARIVEATAKEWTLAKRGAEFLEFEKRDEARWFLGKVAVIFEAAILFDPAQRRATYGERLVEKSIGIAPPQAGSFLRKTRQKGTRVEVQTEATLPEGSTVHGEMGSLRQRVETLVTECGWNFQATVGKPKCPD